MTCGYLPAPLPQLRVLQARKEALRRYGLQKAGSRQTLDRYVQHAKKIFKASSACIFTHCADDDDFMFCISKDGQTTESVELTSERVTKVCAHALLLGEDEVLVVPDLRQDWRFAANPMTQTTSARFYASAPLFLNTSSSDLSSAQKVSIGCLCITNDAPRSDFGFEDVQMLAEIARMACESLEQEHQADLARRAEKIQRAITEIADCSWLCASSSSANLSTDSTTRPYQDLANMQVKVIADILGASATMIDVTPFRLTTSRHNPSNNSFRASTPLFSPSSSISSPFAFRRELSENSPRMIRLPSLGSPEATTRATRESTFWSSHSNTTSFDDLWAPAISSSSSSSSSTQPSSFLYRDSGSSTNGRHSRTSSDIRKTMGNVAFSQADIDPLHMPTIFAQSSNGSTPTQMDSICRAAIGQFLAEWRKEKDQQSSFARYIKGPYLTTSSGISNASSPSEEWDGVSAPISPRTPLQHNPLGPLFKVGEKSGAKPAMYLAMAMTADSDNPQATFLLVVSFDEMMVLEQTDLNLLTACCRIMEHALLRQKVRLAEKAQLDFVRSIQHEMRTPINGISGITDLLRSSVISGGCELDFSSDGFLSSALEGIRLAAGNISSILDDVLDFGDLAGIRSADHQVARLDETSLSPLLEEVGQEEIEIAAIQLRHSAKLTSRGYNHAAALSADEIGTQLNVLPPDFFVNVDPSLRGRFKVDRTTMRKIFRKLLHNSFRFTIRDEEGSGTVQVNIRPASSAELPPAMPLSSSFSAGQSKEMWVSFDFIDTGCGMEAEFIRTRFLQPFAKGDSFQQGAGLGGAIAAGLTHRLGGHLDVSSEPGKGTRVTVVLPLVSLRSTATACMPKNFLTVTKAVYLGFEANLMSAKIAELIQDYLAGFGVRSVESIEEAKLIVATSRFLRSQSCTDLVAPGSARFVVVTSDPLERINQFPCLRESSAHLFQPPFGPAALASMLEYLEEPHPLVPRPLHTPTHRAGEEYVAESHQNQRAGPDGTSKDGANLQLVPEQTQWTSPIEVHQCIATTSVAASHVISPSPEARLSPPHDRPSALDASTTTNFRVLAVEDNPTNMKILTVVLQRQGVEYYVAHDGPEAVEQYIQYRPDIVLLDISLPGFDGFEVCRRLREVEEAEAVQAAQEDRAVNLPARVIAVTALSSKDDQRNGLKMGIDEWHTKPLAPRVLAKFLKVWQSERQTERETAVAEGRWGASPEHTVITLQEAEIQAEFAEENDQ